MNELDTRFIQAMVQAMYRYEAKLTNTLELLTKEEEADFYSMYQGKPT